MEFTAWAIETIHALLVQPVYLVYITISSTTKVIFKVCPHEFS